MAKNYNPSYEEVFWKVESKDVQIHGIDKPKIVSQIEIEGLSSETAWSLTKALYFTKWVWSWLWILPFVWFWFTPTWYNIKAYALWLSTNTDWYSDSTYTTIWNRWVYWYNTGRRDDTPNAIKVRVAVWDRTQANHSSFIEDWIELDFSHDDQNIGFVITAYS